jgi:hypothetical protein
MRRGEYLLESFSVAEFACKLEQISLASLQFLSKSDRQSNARSVGRSRTSETPPIGVSFLPSFFLCACAIKEKSGQ